jgi:hypothetical protein
LKRQWYEHALCIDDSRISFKSIRNEDNKLSVAGRAKYTNERRKSMGTDA